MDEDELIFELNALHEIISLMAQAMVRQDESIDAIGTAVQRLGGSVKREDEIDDSSLN